MEGRSVASQAIMHQKIDNLSLAREKVMLSCDVLLSARQRFLRLLSLNDQERFKQRGSNWLRGTERGLELFTEVTVAY